MGNLHIIEATLSDQTGHAHSHILSILQANSTYQYPIHVWLDKRGKSLFNDLSCSVHAYFHRRFRRVQKLFLYFKLLRSNDIIFVTTSELLDLQIISFYSKILPSKAKVFLYFHQFKQTIRKLAILKKIAKDPQYIQILTSTDKLENIFRQNGYKNCTTIPVPTYSRSHNSNNTTAEFHKILYAGAARADKGFPLVVNLLQYLRQKNIQIPFEIQISMPHSQRYDAPTAQALKILKNLPKDHLQLHHLTLERAQYLQQFNNAICLLLYENSYFHDKISGVALDAFYAGCPLITVSGIWIGEVVEKFNAGIVLADLELTKIHSAIETVIANYAFFQANARKAAYVLQKIHDPLNTLAHVLQIDHAFAAAEPTFATP